MKVMEKEVLINKIINAKTKGEIYYLFCNSSNPNGRTLKKVKEEITKIIEEDFDSFYNKKKFYITKVCPVCNNSFTRKKSEESTTCGYSCSNVYFKELRHPEPTNYRTICFRFHEKECIICGEANIVEVHHLDEDHTNNDKRNLVPLCPTHHAYWHSRYKYLIETKVLEYVKTKWD